MVLVLVVVAMGCSSTVDTNAVERDLWNRYLEPLREAGMEVTVRETCHYPRRPGELWHLDVEATIDAPRDLVADVLEAEGVVVRRDEPGHWVVQQERGRPERGWNGALSDEGGGQALLGVVANNVTVAEGPGDLGWHQVCAHMMD